MVPRNALASSTFTAVVCDLCGSDSNTVVMSKRGALYDCVFSIVKCDACGLVFVNPRLDDATIEALYDADYYNGVGFDRSIGWDTRPLEAVRKESVVFVDTLAEALGGLSGKTILDIGCGFGGLVRALRAEGAEACGLDSSPIAVRACEENGTPLAGESIDELVRRGQRYAAVTMIEVLEHATSPKAFLQSAARLLDPGGVLYVTTGNWNLVSRERLDPGTPYVMPEGHLYYFTPVTLRKYYREIGLEPIGVLNRTWIGWRRLAPRIGSRAVRALAAAAAAVAPGYAQFPLARRPAV